MRGLLGARFTFRLHCVSRSGCLPSFFVGLRSEAGPGHVASGPDFRKEREAQREGECGWEDAAQLQTAETGDCAGPGYRAACGC